MGFGVAAVSRVVWNSEFKVKFIELNPTTYQLLRLIQENNMTGKQALVRLAKDIKHPDTDAVIQFGVEILSDLANQGAIIGSKTWEVTILKFKINRSPFPIVAIAIVDLLKRDIFLH